MESNVARVVDSFPDYLRAETITDRGQLRPRFISPTHDPIPTGTLIGASPQWRAVLKRAHQVASTETTICLQGESGTGKEVVARFIHATSPRRRGPFLAINCARRRCSNQSCLGSSGGPSRAPNTRSLARSN